MSAAIVVAAEAWRIECDPDVIASRLDQELALARQLEKDDFDGAVQLVRDITRHPTQAARQRRREALLQPRAADYHGGPVSWLRRPWGTPPRVEVLP